MAQAKRDFAIGYLTTYRITRIPMGREWGIQLGEGNGRGWLIDARTGAGREFKTLDAAVSALEQIGFEVIELR